MTTASAQSPIHPSSRRQLHRQPSTERNTTIQCPLCDSANCQVSETIPAETLIRDWQKTFEMNISGELKGIQEIQRVQCDDCEFEFFWPQSLAGSAAFYEQLQDFDWYYMQDKWEHQIAVPLIKANDKVLEIGSAEGAFLAKAKRECSCDITGLELNPTAAEMASNNGIPTSCTPLSDFAAENSNQFDVVCSFQVLEHVQHPGTFIRDCIRATKPGGIVIFGVPNEDSFLKHEWTLLNMPPHHVSLWQAETFQRFCETEPVSMLMTRTEPLATYHIDQYIAAHSKQIRSKSWLHRVALCKPVRKTWKRLLKAGLHQRAVGQTLFVALQKDDSK